jgi:hypothetical protein
MFGVQNNLIKIGHFLLLQWMSIQSVCTFFVFILLSVLEYVLPVLTWAFILEV